MVSKGFEFDGMCPTNEWFKGNSMGKNFIGLNLNSVGVMGIQTERGNMWNGPFANTFQAVNNNPGYIASTFWVKILDGPVFNPTINQALWFQHDNNPHYGCSDDNLCGGIVIGDPDDGGGGGNLDMMIAGGNYHTDDFEEENEWMAEEYLFQKLFDDPSLITNSVLQDFYNTNSTGRIGSFNNIKQNTASISMLDSIVTDSVINATSTLQYFQQQLEIEDSLLSDSSADSTSIINSIISIKLEIESLSQMSHSVINDVKSSQDILADNAKDDNAAIIASEQYEQNEKSINDIYLGTIAKRNRNFTSGQVTVIQDIAHQCPFAGGKSVYLARALYRLINRNEQYSDDYVCDQLGYFRKSHPKALKIPYSFVFPNPSDKEIILNYYLPEEMAASASIYNSSLQLVQIIKLEGKSGERIIDVSKNAEGLYLYNIVQNGNITASGKFSVIH
ncbi:MAG: T9SS type A sorting domain-containing protein [Bacteroidota bacterium]